MIYVERQQTWSSVSWFDYYIKIGQNSSARVQICSPADKETKQYDACIAKNQYYDSDIQKVILMNPSIWNDDSPKRGIAK